MKYRKFCADHLFTGYRMLGNENVLITDKKGMIIDLVSKADSGEDIETFTGILCPGFINTHCHLELSHLKESIPERTGLVDFILKVVNERHFDEKVILQAIENAEDDMLQNGIVAVGDICNNTLTINQKKKGRLRYHNFIEVSGFPSTIATARFEKSQSILEYYHSIFGRHCSTLNPHAPYSVSQEIFQLINDLPDNRLLTIHNQESTAEDEFFKNGQGELLRLYEKMNIDVSAFKPSGKSSLQTCLPCFNKNQSIILVHNVSTSAKDLEFIKLQTTNYKLQTSLCLCPNANLYISSTLPNIELFAAHDCNIVLGTDSLASNHQLNILEEIKTLQKNFPKIKLADMLQWATINGAKALQMQDLLGSFEKEKQPGVVLISNMEGFHLTAGSSAKRIL